jgi:hypothetical protein
MKLYQKNTLPGFWQKISEAMDEVDITLLVLKLWVLRVSGMGCYAQKCEKCLNHCILFIVHPYTYIQLTSRPNSEIK